jgi:hypothetical protein
MRLSRILTLIAALTLPALPAAAQGRSVGKPAGVGKPTTTTVKGAPAKGKSADAKAGTLVKGSSGDHAKSGDLAKGGDHGKSGEHAKNTTTGTTGDTTTDATTDDSASKGRGQLPLGEKIALNKTLKARLDALLVGGTLTFDQATTGWKNQGQLVAAMNAAKNNNLSFPSLYTEIITNGRSRDEAVAFLKPPPTPTTTTTITTTTTPATP